MNGPYTYDPKTGRYRGAAGRFVRGAQVKDYTLAVFDRAAGNARVLAQQLQRGEISLAEWQLAMRDEVKRTTLTAAAAANGGWSNLSPADYGRVGRWLAQGPRGGRGQYAYLADFARQIGEGLPLDGRFVRRAEMYARQANAFYERERARAREIMGYDEIRNLRHSRDSCAGCVSETAKGWQKVTGYRYPGSRDCLSSCRCSSQMRNSLTGDVAA